MKRILFELEHTMIALLIVVLFFYFNLSLEGFLISSTIFIVRELTQAEYRWIEKFGSGKRKNLPWYGQFDYRIWDLHSLVFNMLLPILLSSLIFLF